MSGALEDPPAGATTWEEAPAAARTAWRECCARHQQGGDPPARFVCGGWEFILAASGKRYFPAKVQS